jgi:hypothetical protein
MGIVVKIPLAEFPKLYIQRLAQSDHEGFVERGAGVDHTQVRAKNEKFFIRGIRDVFELLAHVEFPFRNDSRDAKKADVIAERALITSAYSSTGFSATPGSPSFSLPTICSSSSIIYRPSQTIL